MQAAFEAQRRFVANASHELRTPLAMMRTSLDVAGDKPSPRPPQLDALDVKLREGLDRADRVLEDFLVLARAEHGVLPERTTASLPEIVSAAIDRCGAAMRDAGIDLRHRCRAARVSGSPTLLARMTDNLIDNAVRHNEPAGWVRVETWTEDGGARLLVDNGGPRLEASVVAELTQPFRRVGGERTGPGTGHGLSIVDAIVNAHRGDLELQARPDGGMHVSITLPGVPDGRSTGEPP